MSPMSSFADPAIKAAMRQRLARLTPTTQRQWGRMTPHQMVCHLCDGFRMASGERPPKQIDNFFTRSFVRYLVLHTSVTWPKGVKTVPEADQERGGTKPLEWDRDFAELVRMTEGFQGIDGNRHPLFGPLTAAEWNIWALRHTNHHLTQFGL